MKIGEAVRNAECLIQWLDERIHDVETPGSTRARLAAGCLDVALEHQKAIVLLVAHKRYGSAFALARLIFEAFIRGVWLWRCASDVEIERFKKQGIDKTFGELIQEVEKLEGYEGGVLSDVKAKPWKMLNSFTHTGYDQVMRRNTETSIEPNYRDVEIVELLSFSNAVGIFVTMAIAYMANQEAFAVSVLEKAKELWDVSP
jgi:hypothetical protein